MKYENIVCVLMRKHKLN